NCSRSLVRTSKVCMGILLAGPRPACHHEQNQLGKTVSTDSRIMADSAGIGNQILFVLFAASVAVWACVFWNALRGRAPLPPAPRESVSWPALPVCATFLVAFYLPLLVVQITRGLKDLPRVEQLCIANVAQIATVVGLLAFAGPLRAADFGCNLSNWRTDLRAGFAGFLASLV